MGGASSSILVHGFSWLYGSSGGEIELQEIVNGLINTQMYNSPGISIALIFITVGIGFKLFPAPSHQWTPDVYEGVRGRGYWQELIESIVWAHNKLKVAPATQPRALSIVQGRAVGVTYYLLGGIATTWAFFLARIIAVG
ncbi:hypothetical protein S245_070334 [Arachis hypogaea]|uniref:NADH:quinone oxidoreductase/Mrp antiporter transmembrane domain-containing protein n=1 Tax=Arachis hypogaea TaxID=3818 RepID=A0A444X2J7_ARAHY|nr:hypothetical protein Ahy_B10g102659 [Arachis hypogaea]